MEEEGERKVVVPKQKKKGVCYISRIPPNLKPTKMRHMLSEYGEVLRIYLVPEDPGARRRRKWAGGNTGKNFTEGWVEFSSKRVARNVAAMLNGQPMGGKRRSAYYYDLWNIKYLKKFKWDSLTEEIAYRNAIQEQKLAVEISAAKRERDFYLARVEESRGIRSIQEKKRKKQEANGGEDENGAPEQKILRVEESKLRKYSQKQAISSQDEPAARLSSDVLAGVFARKADS